jgi:hypothetical protein
VRREHQDRLRQPIQGWFGQRDQFAMGHPYDPVPGISRYLAGTPPVIALTAVEASVDLLARTGISALRAKSVALTAYLVGLWRPGSSRSGSPWVRRKTAKRGGHVRCAIRCLPHRSRADRTGERHLRLPGPRRHPPGAGRRLHPVRRRLGGHGPPAPAPRVRGAPGTARRARSRDVAPPAPPRDARLAASRQGPRGVARRTAGRDRGSMGCKPAGHETREGRSRAVAGGAR